MLGIHHGMERMRLMLWYLPTSTYPFCANRYNPPNVYTVLFEMVVRSQILFLILRIWSIIFERPALMRLKICRRGLRLVLRRGLLRRVARSSVHVKGKSRN